jgi:hypothetical protein
MADDTVQQDRSGRAKFDAIIREALAIEAEDAAAAGAVGYMARALVQATMPHSDPKGLSFTRKNGAFTMSLLAHSEIGLPYGSLPRLLVSFLTTRAFVTKCREIDLGSSLSAFMAELKEIPTGGRWGTINRVKDQTMRLFTSSISCTYTSGRYGTGGFNLAVSDEWELWWSPQNPEQLSMFGNSVTLGERFFNEVVSSPVPVDMRAMRWLKKSPMALDIYTWLTYRMSYLSKPTLIPWPVLQMQFGGDYTRTRAFKEFFLLRLKDVLCLYPVRLEVLPEGLELRPSPPHVARRIGG